uniref:Alternative protein UBE2K n=1 Tax=Homo sapiens TaxID=9606 RepID=L8E874_HUMAN|nr:alternative protein UBE2K [Homo sapiens]
MLTISQLLSLGRRQLEVFTDKIAFIPKCDFSSVSTYYVTRSICTAAI